VVTSKTHRITKASGAFTVPTASQPPTGFASNMVGIGGFRTTDLIEAGPAEFATTTGTTYFAWYELLPAPETQLSNCSGDSTCTVTPGDHMRVKIRRVSSARWKISMTDHGHWSFSKTVTYHSSRYSAEWILLAPTVNGTQSSLPQLSTSFYGPTSTYTVRSVTKTIAQGNPDTIIMNTPTGAPEATPSKLDSGQSFNTCAYAPSCVSPP
jgi:hypothetical protein